MTEPEWLKELKKESVGVEGDDEIYDELDLSLSTLKPGLVLWNGSQSLTENTTMTKRELWWGRGQMSGYSSRPETDPEFVVKFFSTDTDVAKSYARCIPYSQGWIHKFEVSDPIPILKIGANTYLEWDEVERLCNFAFKYNIKGISIPYGDGSLEVALCTWVPELKYVGSQRCLPNKKWTPLYDARRLKRKREPEPPSSFLAPTRIDADEAMTDEPYKPEPRSRPSKRQKEVPKYHCPRCHSQFD